MKRDMFRLHGVSPCSRCFCCPCVVLYIRKDSLSLHETAEGQAWSADRPRLCRNGCCSLSGMVMKKVIDTVKRFFERLRHYVSPVFVMLLVVSFTLWYIAKLNYKYTTEFDVKVNVDGQRFTVPCVVEGVGTNLLGYVYASRRINIPLSELHYSKVRDADHVQELGAEPEFSDKIQIDPASLQSAISVRFSDIKIISIGVVPEIEIPEK